MLEFHLGAVVLTFARRAFVRLRIGRYEVGGAIPNGGVSVDVTMTASQLITLKAEGVDKNGLDAGEPKQINWSTSDSTLLTVQQNPDGSASVTKGTQPRVGSATVTAADGDDTTVPVATVNVTVTAGPIVGLVITASTPVEV